MAFKPRLWALAGLLAGPLAAKDNAPPGPLEAAVAAQTREAQERVIFQTTASVWKTNSRRVVTNDGKPAPNLVAVSAIGIMDAMTGVVTIPFDIVAAPFRKPSKFKMTTWDVSGRLIDRAGRPRGGVSLAIMIDRTESARTLWPGHTASAFARTDQEGRFSAALTGRAEKDERSDISIYSLTPDGDRVLEKRSSYP
ncbi:MAG: hypothetical protein HY077_11875 [Elusimicrobia bacterium]|nr:hypothetical protein [Elusimicrobiota bacterium]